MEFRCLPIFCYLNLMLMATHAALPPELYWKRMLPSTPMPKAITELLSRVKWGQSTDIEIQSEDDFAFDWAFATKETQLPDQKRPLLRQDSAKLKAQLDMRGQQVDNQTEFHDDVRARLNSDTETRSHNDANSPLLVIEHAVNNDQLQNHPNADMFFLEEGLRAGQKMDVHFSKSKNTAPLLPRQITEGIPFSLDHMTEVLDKFSVKPKSKKAKIIEKAIRHCEVTGIKGEERYCATSLESLVDFITSKLGTNVQAVSTEVDNDIKLQKFEVKDGVKMLAEDGVAACHRLNYPYAVFLCHKVMKSSAYFVPLEGEDGVRVKAVAVCHRDTSAWDPKHLAFLVLKVKPGTVPVCHFSPESNVIWLPK